MEIIVDNILRNETLRIFNMIFGVAATAIMLILYFGKYGKDERGRGIFASSCLISILIFFVLINIYASLYEIVASDESVFIHTTQILYNIVVFIQIICIFMLRRGR